MQAVLRQGGGMVLIKDYPVPNCSPDTVLIRVKAAGINPVDYKAGTMMLGKVVGVDMAGVVVKAGAKVTQFKEGDEVYGSVHGTLADFVTVKPDSIALKPSTCSFAEAAALPVAYVTSLKSLRDYGNLKKGGSILIIGASGGTGLSAVQLAKAYGATKIVGVCSGRNEELVRSHGCTDVIDYTQTNTTDWCKEHGVEGETLKFDVVYDCATNSGAGEDYYNSSLSLLKPARADGTGHGQYVSINGTKWRWMRAMTFGLARNQHLFFVKPCTADFNELTKFIDEGWQNEAGQHDRLKILVAECLPLNEENLVKGFDLLKSRRVTGKIVFEVSNDEIKLATQPAS